MHILGRSSALTKWRQHPGVVCVLAASKTDPGIAPQIGPKGNCSAVYTINTRHMSAGSNINDASLSGRESSNMICVGSSL